MRSRMLKLPRHRAICAHGVGPLQLFILAFGILAAWLVAGHGPVLVAAAVVATVMAGTTAPALYAGALTPNGPYKAAHALSAHVPRTGTVGYTRFRPR